MPTYLLTWNPGEYPWPELEEKWEHGLLTLEQLYGQLIVHGEQMDARQLRCQRTLDSLQRAVADLQASEAGLQASGPRWDLDR